MSNRVVVWNGMSSELMVSLWWLLPCERESIEQLRSPSLLVFRRCRSWMRVSNNSVKDNGYHKLLNLKRKLFFDIGNRRRGFQVKASLVIKVASKRAT